MNSRTILIQGPSTFHRWAIVLLVVLSVGLAGAAAAERLRVGDRQVQIASAGSGTPTVVIEAGLGEPPVESGTWSNVVAAVSRHTRVFWYDRAGLGASAPAPAGDRTSAVQAKELRATLRAANVPPPYLLVGHSLGGYIVRLFAEKHPNEVVGMVLVDATHPDQWSRWLAALPPARPDEPPSIADSRRFLELQKAGGAGNPEALDLARSGDLVRTCGSLGDRPLAVISHSRHRRIAPELPDAVGERMEDAALELQRTFLKLSSQSRLWVATNAGHYVQAEEPATVIAAIEDVLRAARPTTVPPASAR